MYTRNGQTYIHTYIHTYKCDLRLRLRRVHDYVPHVKAFGNYLCKQYNATYPRHCYEHCACSQIVNSNTSSKYCRW